MTDTPLDRRRAHAPWLAFLLAVPPGGDPVGDGLQHYREGRFAAAAASFREALAADPDNPRLNYNLALALWR